MDRIKDKVSEGREVIVGAAVLLAVLFGVGGVGFGVITGVTSGDLEIGEGLLAGLVAWVMATTAVAAVVIARTDNRLDHDV